MFRLIQHALLRYFPENVIYASGFVPFLKKALFNETADTLVVASTSASAIALARLKGPYSKSWYSAFPEGLWSRGNYLLRNVSELQFPIFERTIRSTLHNLDFVATTDHQHCLDRKAFTELGAKTVLDETEFELEVSNVTRKQIKKIVLLATGNPRNIDRLFNFAKNLKDSGYELEILHLWNSSNKNTPAKIFNYPKKELEALGYRRIEMQADRPSLHRFKIMATITRNYFADAFFRSGMSNIGNITNPDLLVPEISGKQKFVRGLSSWAHSKLPQSVLRHLYFIPSPISQRMDTFANNAILAAANFEYSLVHSVDFISLPAGDRLASYAKARHIMDVNEFPVFEARVGRDFKSLTPFGMRNLYKAVREPFERCDARIAYSNGLARVASRVYSAPVKPIRNFHNAIKLKRSKKMSREFHIPSDAIILTHVCTMAEAYKSDVVIEMMAKLPSHYHLVFVGTAMNAAYQKKLDGMVESLGLVDRIHFKREIANTEDYLNYVSEADLGVVIMSNAIANVRFGLSNRFADLLASGVPMVSTYTLETAPLIKQYDIGSVVRDISAENLSREVLEICSDVKRLKQIKKNCRKARKQFSREVELSRYFEMATGDIDPKKPKHALFVFQRGLVRNRRCLFFSEALIQKGWDVTFLVSSLPHPDIQALSPKANFVRIPVGTSISDKAIKNRIRHQFGDFKYFQEPT